MTNIPDERETTRLLEQAVRGDQRAWEQLLARHRDRLRRMVALRLDRRLQARVNASDVIQEASLEAVRRLPEYLGNPSLPFFLWLRFLTGQRLMEQHRIHFGVKARDVCREIALYHGALPETTSAALAAHLLGHLTSPSEAAMRVERRIRMQEVLNAMDPIDREILALRHYEQLSNSEVATVLDLDKFDDEQAIRAGISAPEGDPGRLAGRPRGVVNMSNPGSSVERDPIDRLAESFLARFRAGQRPSIEEYASKYPELAEEIRDLLAALVQLEENLAPEAAAARSRVKPSEAESRSGLPPRHLGDFLIVREVGRGGMGIVYEAVQQSLGRHVALKLLPTGNPANRTQIERFRLEARAAARLHHTNIVPVFGVGEHDGLRYYVMQFIQGLGLDQVLEELKRLRHGPGDPMGKRKDAWGEPHVSLRDVSTTDLAQLLLTGRFVPAADQEGSGPAATSAKTVDPVTVTTAGLDQPVHPAGAGQTDDTFSLNPSSTTLPGVAAAQRSGKKRPTYWQSVGRIGVQVAEALEHAHKQGVLHRDVKPSNLLLDTRGTVWVTDFGLAKMEDQPNLTNTGDILGTLRYMPPEAFDGRADRRGDIYSLGLTLYELPAMRPAFQERDAQSAHQAGDDRRAAPARQAEPRNPPRPGDHRPQGDRSRGGAAIPDGRRPGRRLAAIPR